MALEVFRRHQRKLLAIFAILAMFGFVVSDSLPRLLNSNAAGRDQPVVKLYDKMIFQSDLNEMAVERSYANQLVARLIPFYGQNPFGALKTRDMVDALILQHEADRLGLPSGPELGEGVPQASDAGPHDRRDVRCADGRVQQPGQRRAGPRRHRRPGADGGKS